jgi:hypothetical protein
VEEELYSSRDQIASSLKRHILSMKKANEDIRILSVKYLLEILESKGEKQSVLVEKGMV